ncbi:23S rRNA (pseudouridine(1915)-N(3))-methyltransferase RlmH [Bacillota bacterium LX-D]|nr:23S rRNA (pseudouridine(1915)-N(3))-methyltransferase RlmH [Bacillota bacterium LX-D]
MLIKLITVGKVKEKYLKEGIAEFLKRLGPYAKVEIIEVQDESTPDKASALEEEQIKEKEAERISKHLKTGTFVIALALEGKMLSSEQLAQKLHSLGLEGKSDLTFLIGGSLGLAPSILAKADFRLCLSPLTFPHQLVRLILLEQIYRSFRIMRGEPYHK